MEVALRESRAIAAAADGEIEAEQREMQDTSVSKSTNEIALARDVPCFGAIVYWTASKGVWSDWD